ncbi:MAG: hypothetical protein ACFHHU_13825 [Porticoccaceae bacterium]
MRSAAEKVGNYRLPGATLYASVEPCTDVCRGNNSFSYQPSGYLAPRNLVPELLSPG